MLEPCTVRTSLVQSFEELQRYGQHWTFVTNDHPMHSWNWLSNWWKTYRAPTDELFVILVDDRRGQLIGIAPFYRRRKYGQRILRWLGDGQLETEQLGIFAVAGWRQRVVSAVSERLVAERKEWDRLVLQSTEVGSSGCELAERLQADGFESQALPSNSCWRMAIPGDWGSFLASLPKSQRKRCRRRLRGELHEGDWQPRHVEQPGDFEYAFRILRGLHGAWAGRNEQPNLFAAEPFRRFHATTGRQLLRHKRLRLCWLEYKGRPVSAAYQFLQRPQIHSYLTAIDPDAAHLSPGHLLMLAGVEFAMEHGFSGLCLPRGAEGYQRLWGATEIPCIELRIWPVKWSAGRSGAATLARVWRGSPSGAPTVWRPWLR